MNFVDVAIQFQVEVNEKDSNHLHMELRRMVLYPEPSEIVAGKQTGTVQGALRQAFKTIERHLPQEWEKDKRQFRPPALPNMQADNLEDMRILVGEVYDERIIEDF